MSTNEAAKLVSVPTHTIAHDMLCAAHIKLKTAGMHNLAQQLWKRIATDPRTRGLEHGKLVA